MSQETIARIFAIEKTAAKLHSDAQQQAAAIVAEAEKAADDIRKLSLAQARQDAEHIIATGEQQAESENARIIAQAGADAQRLDAIAATHLERAVDFVLARVVGQA